MNGSLIHGAVLGLAILITMICVYGVLSPKAMTGWMLNFWEKPSAFYAAVIGRLVMGALFILVAATSRLPDLFMIIGGLSIAAAVIIAIVGRDRVDKVIRWGMRLPPMIMRLWCLMGVGLGLLMGYGVM